ncbi:MAG: HD domain-containing phosphohydrolase [Spirochaetales bacterium]
MKEHPLILVVDDTSQNVDLLEAHLLPFGYEVIKASSGAQALEILATQAIDLVLLDVMMPGLDGFQVTKKIRVQPKFRLLPIVLVTALRDTDDRVLGIEAGCDDFISKPVEKAELLARVKALLEVKSYNDLMSRYREALESEVAQRTAELSQALAKVKASSLDTIMRLTLAAEYRDGETGAHVQRMSRYAVAIARQMGLDEVALEQLLHAAPMHDLGKIGVPDEILLKAGQLDPLEWEIMKKHTLIGASILAQAETDFFQMVETIALCHHEKWDGSGYPQGLSGTQIPLVGRIIAVADVFDALTSQRPYKAAFLVDEALAIMRDGRGSHFDPQVCDAFFACLDEILTIKSNFSIKTMATVRVAGLKELIERYAEGKAPDALR